MFKKETKESTKTNFSCNLNTQTEFEPFQAMCDECGINKTEFFRIMLRGQLKSRAIQKSLLKNAGR